jgi:hypothetical protein
MPALNRGVEQSFVRRSKSEVPGEARQLAGAKRAAALPRIIHWQRVFYSPRLVGRIARDAQYQRARLGSQSDVGAVGEAIRVRARLTTFLPCEPYKTRVTGQAEHAAAHSKGPRRDIEGPLFSPATKA